MPGKVLAGSAKQGKGLEKLQDVVNIYWLEVEGYIWEWDLRVLVQTAKEIKSEGEFINKTEFNILARPQK